MNPSCQELEADLAAHLAGERNAAVDRHLLECPSCRASVELWRQLANVPAPVPSPALAATFRRKLARGNPWQPWLAAAAVLLAAFAGFWLGRRESDVAALRAEVGNLREVVALSLLDQRSASDRLRGIRFSAALENEEPEVVAALNRTFRADPSVDVRLAAADALRRFRLAGSTRETAWQLLQADESPLVQIAAIDLLAAARDPRLPALVSNSSLHPSVAAYLRSALSNSSNRGSNFQ